MTENSLKGILKQLKTSRNTQQFLTCLVCLFSPDLDRVYSSFQLTFSSDDLKKERLLFYSFYVRDVDTVLSKNFDVNVDGIDAVGGIPFSESPSLTIGHGASGNFLCS